MIRRARPRHLLVAVLLLLGQACAAQAPPVPIDQLTPVDWEYDLDVLASTLVDRSPGFQERAGPAFHDSVEALRLAAAGRFSGVVRVERTGRLLSEQTFGFANVELSVPNQPHTRFRLHSLTEPFTAASVLRAVDQDRIRLDASICDYLEPCPERWASAGARLRPAGKVTPTPSERQGLDRAFEPVVERWVEDGVGVQAHVRIGGRDWSGAAGLADLRTGKPMTPTTPMRTASITKAFTYALVDRLAREGKLELKAPLSAYMPLEDLPSFPHIEEVTVGQLLHHRGGLAGFTESEAFLEDFFAQVPPDAMPAPVSLLAYATANGTMPVHPPDTAWAYSNSGYFLLGMLVEAVTGRSYSAVLRKELLDPLEMTRSFLEGTGEGQPAPSYVRADDFIRDRKLFPDAPQIRDDGLLDLTASRPDVNAWAWAAGGLASTARDLVRFGEAYRSERIHLDQRVFMKQAEDPGLLVLRGGSWGIDAQLLIDRKAPITVAVISNTTVGSAQFPAWEISRELHALARSWFCDRAPEDHRDYCQ